MPDSNRTAGRTAAAPSFAAVGRSRVQEGQPFPLGATWDGRHLAYRVDRSYSSFEDFGLYVWDSRGRAKPKKVARPPPPRETALSDDPHPTLQPDTFFATAKASERYSAIVDAGGWPTDLVAVGRRARVVTGLRSTLGLPGRLASRLQPNHPTDDLRGVAASTLDGLLYGGGFTSLGDQTLGVLVAVAYCGVITTVIAFAIKFSLGWRIEDEDEVGGIDLAEHGESAYDLHTGVGGGVKSSIVAGATSAPLTEGAHK